MLLGKSIDHLQGGAECEYEGKYVAVLNGQVVDSDGDERALVQRVYQKFGYQPMYVQLVTLGSLPVHRLVSPQVVMSSINSILRLMDLTWLWK